MNDEKIIELYWARSEEAIRESDAKYGAYCYAVAYNILSEERDSEECVSDTWLRAWGSIPPQRPNYLRQFFAKITRNLSIDRYRRQKRINPCAPLDELAECVSGTDTIENALQQTALAESINRFLHKLPARECGIFLRRYFYAETVARIAAQYRVKESNVYMILSRTRKKLREHLLKEGFEL